MSTLIIMTNGHFFHQKITAIGPIGWAIGMLWHPENLLLSSLHKALPFFPKSRSIEVAAPRRGSEKGPCATFRATRRVGSFEVSSGGFDMWTLSTLRGFSWASALATKQVHRTPGSLRCPREFFPCFTLGPRFPKFSRRGHCYFLPCRGPVDLGRSGLCSAVRPWLWPCRGIGETTRFSHGGWWCVELSGTRLVCWEMTLLGLDGRPRSQLSCLAKLLHDTKFRCHRVKVHGDVTLNAICGTCTRYLYFLQFQHFRAVESFKKKM